MAVLGNCRFSEHVLRHELERYDLARRLTFVMVSAEYAVRKPCTMLFEAAAKRLQAIESPVNQPRRYLGQIP